MTGRPGDILIGTSGWSYDHWRGRLYPEELPGKQWLAYYSRYLPSVEINNSFYHLPEKATLRHWRDSVPQDFVFSVKASRYITHMKKLKEPAEHIDRLFDHITELGDRLGPILFQLPPHWRNNAERLDKFLAVLSADFRYAFELRDRSWLNEKVYQVLQRHRAALCIYDLDGFESPRHVTTDLVYVRLHGPDGAYRGNYRKPALAGWADFLSDQSAQGRDCYCYFDNDAEGYAVDNARRLQSLLHRNPDP